MIDKEILNELKSKLVQIDIQKDSIAAIATYAKKVTQAERCSIFLYHKDKDQLKTVYADGIKGTMTLKSNMGIVGYAFHKKTTIIENDTHSSQLFFKTVDTKTNYTTQTILAVPILQDNKRIGVIELLNKKDGFNSNDKAYIEMFSKLLINIFFPSTIDMETLQKKEEEKSNTLQAAFDTYLDSRRLYLMENGSAYYKIEKMKREYFIAADQCYLLKESPKNIDIYYYSTNEEFLFTPMLIKLDNKAQNLLISENSTEKKFVSHTLEKDDLDIS